MTYAMSSISQKILVGIFSYIYNKKHPNVGSYIIHGSFGYYFIEMVLSFYPRKTNMASWKTHHEWRCISHWTWGFSTAMLVFRGVTNFMHLGCIFVPRKLIIVTSYQPQPVIRISEPSTVLLCVLQYYNDMIKIFHDFPLENSHIFSEQNDGCCRHDSFPLTARKFNIAPENWWLED